MYPHNAENSAHPSEGETRLAVTPETHRVSVYVVDDEPTILELLQEVLSREDFAVTTFLSAEAVIPALEGGLPDLLMTDLSMPGLSGADLVQHVRRLPGGLDLPIVIASAHFCNGVPEDFRERSTANLLMAKPFVSLFGLGAELRELLHEEAPSEPLALTREREERRPDRAALAVLTTAWRQQSSGLVRRRGRQVAVLRRGDLAGTEEHSAVVEGLYAGGITFAQEPASACGDLKRLGPALYGAALNLASPRTVIERLDSLLVERQGVQRLAELPLGPSLWRLLREPRNNTTTLRQLMASAGVEAEDCALGLGALMLLGLFRLRPAVAALPSAPREPAKPALLTANDRRHLELALSRLEREVRLLQSVDDNTALGVARGTESHHINSAYERQRDRYEALMRDAALGPRGRALTRQILDRIELAWRRLRKPPASAPPSPSSEAQLFERGLAALTEYRYDDAARYFEAARSINLSSARNMGYLGWAVFNDVSRSRDARWSEAHDLLALSVSMSPELESCQLFLAQIEAQLGDYVQAEARLQRVLLRNPSNTEARVLLRRVRQDSTPD